MHMHVADGNKAGSVAANCNQLAEFCSHSSVGKTVKERCPGNIDYAGMDVKLAE